MTDNQIDIHWSVRIPLRDGVNLGATVYLPRSRQSRVPCIVGLCPYVADTFHERAAYFARNGLPFVMVDSRGRGNSEGEFKPYIQEARDGYDVIEWVAKQPYCDGQVGMWGASYLGYVQWATAKEFPPHLSTIVPAAAPYMAVDFPMRNNIFYPYLLQWLTLVGGRTIQRQIFADASFWSDLYRKWFVSGKSFRELDTLMEARLPILQEWLDHPEPDAYWDAQNPSSDDYRRLTLPILTITGSYDDDQPGALEHYKQHMRHASPETREQHYLVLGPWDHVGTVVPKAEFGGIKLGPRSEVDLAKLHREWYAWTMQAGPKPEFLKKRVSYYVMEADEWRHADSLEEITESEQTYFLDSQGGADDLFQSGSLGLTVGAGSPDAYTYDPRDTRGPELDAEARSSGGSLVDQSVLVALRGKALVYHTAPLETDTEISGFFRFDAWVAIDCPDTDLYVSVHEVCSDGSSVRLSTDAMRARYREGLRTPRLIDTETPLRYRFERFTFVSRKVKRGNRLRLVVAPIGRLIESTFTQRNCNVGGVVSEETVERARPVTVRLFHDKDRPSALHVPLGRKVS